MSQYDEDREELQQKVELLQAFDRLANNADFKRIILKGFCQHEVIELNRQASRELTVEAKIARSQQAQAAPVLETYFIKIQNEGAQARDNLPQLDALNAEEDPELTR